jgi:hypothetical protein
MSRGSQPHALKDTPQVCMCHQGCPYRLSASTDSAVLLSHSVCMGHDTEHTGAALSNRGRDFRDLKEETQSMQGSERQSHGKGEVPFAIG